MACFCTHYCVACLLARLLSRWHLWERHVSVAGAPVPGGIFDFALYFFHNAAELLRRGSGPYFYLPKMQSHLECRLWNDIFVESQRCLGIPNGAGRGAGLRRWRWRSRGLVPVVGLWSPVCAEHSSSTAHPSCLPPRAHRHDQGDVPDRDAAGGL